MSVSWTKSETFDRADILQFTGDGAGRDHEGYYWIRGRVDDVVNVSGHRLSTAEIEAALLEHGERTLMPILGIPG